MSATPGKFHLLGKARLGGERVFLLTMLQARVPEHVGRPFFARYDPDATWLTDLHPAFGAERFPFERRSRESPSPLDRAAGSRFGTARVRPARCGGGRGRRLDDSERGRASGPAAGWREPGGAD